MKIRKQFIFDEETVQDLLKIKEENNIKSETATIKYIVDMHKQYKDEDARFEKLLKIYDERCRGLTERIKWASQTAEQNSTIILDVLNTILHTGTCKSLNAIISVDYLEHDIILQSRQIIKDKIAHFKQAKDDRLKKQQT